MTTSKRENPSRSLIELREVVGTLPGLPVNGMSISSAFADGRITTSEAKRLQQHSRLTPRRQREVVEADRPVTDEQLAAVRAKLNAVRSKMTDRDSDQPWR